MEYNNYYPAHPSPSLANHHHHGPQMQTQQPPPPMMHATLSAQNIRQTINSGPANQQQHMQHQQIIAQHAQQPMALQQHHTHYHQIQQNQSQHGPPLSHSASPHSQHQPDQNLQPSLSRPPSQSQQHHAHPHSPYHHSGSHMHMQQQQQQSTQSQQQQQPLNHMVRSSLGPSVTKHPHVGLQQPMHPQQNYYNSPMPQSSSVHHFSQQNQHHSAHPYQHHQQHHQHSVVHHNHPSMSMHHSPHQPPPLHPPSHAQQSLLQTEFRIIELNRRLQSRPIQRYPISPLPSVGNPYDEEVWWEKFASEFFEDDATLTLRIQEDKPVEFTIGRTLIPKFFRTYFDGGVTDLSINLRNPKETCTHPHTVTLDCDQTFIVTNNIYKHPAISTNQGVVVHTEGRLVLEFVSNNDTLSIKSWKFYTKCCREYIDRSVLALGLPNSFLVEPITRQGLTKSTVSYLKMCMIMEPMQDIIVLHRHTKLDPRSCMQKLLVDKYKFRAEDDNRTLINKRRKRKPSAAPAASGPTGRKSKANMSNAASIANSTNNIVVTPPSAPSFSLASQDVMVVGEPSIMGGDFADDNERIKTQLENSQYDPSTSAPPSTKTPDGLNTHNGSNNPLSAASVSRSADSPSVTSSLLQTRSQQLPPPNQSVQSNPQIPNQPQETVSQERVIVEQNQKNSDLSEDYNHKQTLETSQQQHLVPQPAPSQPAQPIDEANGRKSKSPDSNFKGQIETKQDHKQSTEHQPTVETTKPDSSDGESILENDSSKHTEPEELLRPKSEDSVGKENSGSVLIEEVQTNSRPTSEDSVVKENNESVLNEEVQTNSRPPSEDSVGKENNGSVLNEEIQTNSTATQSENQFNIMNSIPEDREDTCKPDQIVAKLPPSSNNKSLAVQNGSSNKQNRRRSSERKETLREGLMRTSDFVVAMKDLKCEHPALWRITTGNNLLQQFEPKTQNGVVLYENTNQYAGWNPEIKRDYVGVDVRLTQHTRNQITVERLLLNFQRLDDLEAFYDKHFVIYLQILLSTALDPKFWEGIENEPGKLVIIILSLSPQSLITSSFG